MNKKLLKYLIFIFGLICLFAFISIRYLPLYNTILEEDAVENYWDKTKYGELYYFSHIRHFRESNLPPSQQKFEYSSKHASTENSNILCFGDSFFEISRNKQFPERIADDFNKGVHYVNNDHPLDYLNSQDYINKESKLLIFERVERYIPITFENKHTINPANNKVKSSFTEYVQYIKSKIFVPRSEQLYDVMLKRSYLTTNIYSIISTIKFDLFRYISNKTPRYLKNGGNSWLFYHDQINEDKTSFYYKHTQSEMDNICNNMKELADNLKQEYNLIVVFLPLPAKYTLCHNVINDDEYNDFLPQLYCGLDKLGVKYINVFDDFIASDTLLYYRTDGHWNQKGIDIAYSKTIEYIKSDSTLAPLLQQ